MPYNPHEGKSAYEHEQERKADAAEKERERKEAAEKAAEEH
jgi:hypothetical protein